MLPTTSSFLSLSERPQQLRELVEDSMGVLLLVPQYAPERKHNPHCEHAAIVAAGDLRRGEDGRDTGHDAGAEGKTRADLGEFAGSSQLTAAESEQASHAIARDPSYEASSVTAPTSAAVAASTPKAGAASSRLMFFPSLASAAAASSAAATIQAPAASLVGHAGPATSSEGLSANMHAGVNSGFVSSGKVWLAASGGSVHALRVALENGGSTEEANGVSMLCSWPMFWSGHAMCVRYAAQYDGHLYRCHARSCRCRS